MNNKSYDSEDLKLIKKGESGERELKLENKLHKSIIVELYNNPKTMVELNEQIGLSEIELMNALKSLKKVGFLKLEKDKYITDFIILDRNQTKVLHDEIKKYAEKISPSIIKFLEESKKEILDLDARFNKIKWDQLIDLLVFIFIDFMCEDICQELNHKYGLNKSYNKAYSICGYISEDHNYIARNNTFVYNIDEKIQKLGLFTYGKGQIESFNKDMIYGERLILDTGIYVKLIYIMYKAAEKLRGNVLQTIAEALEHDVPKYIENQTGFVIQNYMMYLRYEVMLVALKNKTIQGNNKSSFIMLYDNE